MYGAQLVLCSVITSVCFGNALYHLISSFPDPVIALAMEPVGSKFAIIHGEPPTRISASFYKTGDKGAPATKISGFAEMHVGASWLVCVPSSGLSCLFFSDTLEKIMANHIFWCPTGQFVVLAGLKRFRQSKLVLVSCCLV